MLDNSRGFVHFFLNGQEQKIEGGEVFLTLADFLRQRVNCPGTKVVCAEGDCGACTVLIGRLELSRVLPLSGSPVVKETGVVSHFSESKAKVSQLSRGQAGCSADWKINYLPVNSCIQYLYQLDGTHVISVEGLKSDLPLNSLQQAMVDKNGSQCGYCTPGIVMALTALAEKRRGSLPEKVGPQCGVEELKELKDALTGNLCRCTGYEGILEAGLCSLFVEHSERENLEKLFPAAPIIAALKASRGQSCLLSNGRQRVFIPATLPEVLEILDKETGVAIVSGGTDVCVNMNKRAYQPLTIMSLAGLQALAEFPEIASAESAAGASSSSSSFADVDAGVRSGRKKESPADLRRIELVEDARGRYLQIGALVTLGQLEPVSKELLPQFYEILRVFGSPQIRSVATLAGNIANGSPIGDSLPFLCAINALLELSSLAADGSRQTRQVPVAEFYLGYKQLDCRPNEFITQVLLPLPKEGQIIRLYKISKRQHLDISAFAAAIAVTLCREEKGEPRVAEAAIALGGVAATVLRMKELEAYLLGKPHVLETYEKLGILAAEKLKPISDVRGSRAYRLNLARNIFTKFYYDCDSVLEA